jgi:hypothetical protein
MDAVLMYIAAAHCALAVIALAFDVLGIENRDPITVIVLVMKYKLVSVIAMCGRLVRQSGNYW